MITIKQLSLITLFLLLIGCAPNAPQPVPPLIIPDPTEETATSVPEGSAVATETNQAEKQSPQAAVAIAQFGFVEAPTKPSEAALLEWEVSGVDEVTITRTGGDWGEAGEQWRVPAKGSMVHTFVNTLGGQEIVYRLEADEGISAEFAINLLCEHAWAFDNRSAVCPAAARESAGVQQNFENGILLSIEAQNIILFTTWNGQTHSILTDTYAAGVDPLRAEGLIPPEGYLQPEGNLGKIWREYHDARAALGWAIGPPEALTVVRQGETSSRTGAIKEYITLADDHWVFIDQAVLVWDVTYPKPDVTWAGQRPPLSFTDLMTAGTEEASSAENTASPTPTPAPTSAVATSTPAAVVSTSTPPPATAAANATPVASGGVTVHQFGFDRDPQKPSDTVLLQWNISGVSTIHVERFGGEWGEANATYDLPARGTLEQTFPPEVSGWSVSYVVTSEEAPDFEHHVSTTMPCEWDWLFDFPYPGAGCPEQGIVSNGSFQTFERGFMIWVETQDVILYSTWDGLQTNRISDDFVHDVDLVKDESINPPAGLFQPEYGFGKAWREHPGVRDLLGWGTDWSRSYTVFIQSEPFSRYGHKEYISMLGGLITIDHPDPFWKIEYPR